MPARAPDTAAGALRAPRSPAKLRSDKAKSARRSEPQPPQGLQTYLEAHSGTVVFVRELEATLRGICGALAVDRCTTTEGVKYDLRSLGMVRSVNLLQELDRA